MTERSASIGFPSTCQKVQPLQASRPAALAPMRWIEPTAPSSASVPSARTSALTRPPARRIGLVALDADEMPAEALGGGARRAGAEERVEYHVAGLRARDDDAREQRLGFLSRVQLLAGSVLEALLAGAQRQRPVRAHLHVIVARLERLVVEGVATRLLARRPDERLMRVGEAAAAEVRHGVGLAPHHIVEDPKVELLQEGAAAKDVVVGADDPQRGVSLHHAAAGGEPLAGEAVIGLEARALVPGVVDRGPLGGVPALHL